MWYASHIQDTPCALKPLQEGAELLVWCKASCGNNIHKQCFDKWAAAKRGNGQQVTCVYCRAAWPDAAGEHLGVFLCACMSVRVCL